MKSRAALLLLLLVLVATPASSSTSATALYNRGNDFYQAGSYQQAREAYLQALTTGLVNSELYFNLANAELRAGLLGPAVAHYLRAQRLDPRDPDLGFNLEYARGRIKARLPELPQGPLRRAFDRAVGFMSANEWSLLLIGAYWLAAAAAIGLILAPADLARLAFRYLLFVALAGLILAAPFAATSVKRDLFTPRAVIMVDKVTARSGPGPDNAELFELYEGMDVAVGQCESGWCRVSAPGGFIGWVTADSFENL